MFRHTTFMSNAKRAILCSLIACFLLAAIMPSAGAVTQSEINTLKERQAEISANKQTLQAQITQTQGNKEKAIQQKVLLEEQIEVIRDELDATNAVIDQLDVQIEEQMIALDAAEQEEARYTELFYQRVRSMEENGNTTYWAVLFGAGDFADLIDRVNMIQEIMDYDNSVMDKLEESRIEVGRIKGELESSRAEQQQSKVQLESTEAELVAQQVTLDALVKEISAEESAYKSQLAALSEDEVDLSKEISAAEKQYAAQIQAQANSGSNSGSGSSSSGVSLTGNGGFIWPLPGYTTLSSPYGWRTHPITGKKSYHGAADVPAPAGTNILAAKSGTVVISTFHNSYGNYVVIAHADGSKTLYAHMKSRAVSAGSTVSQGSVIGYVGTTGSSTGNHLHFEVWEGSTSSTRTNPMRFFS